jgi:hypothetical protein
LAFQAGRKIQAKLVDWNWKTTTPLLELAPPSALLLAHDRRLLLAAAEARQQNDDSAHHLLFPTDDDAPTLVATGSLLLLPSIAAAAIARRCWSLGSWPTASIVCGTAAVLVCAGGSAWSRLREKRLKSEFSALVSSLEGAAASVAGVLRILQEAELVGRGYIVDPDAEFLPPVARLEARGTGGGGGADATAGRLTPRRCMPLRVEAYKVLTEAAALFFLFSD